MIDKINDIKLKDVSQLNKNLNIVYKDEDKDILISFNEDTLILSLNVNKTTIEIDIKKYL